MEHRLAQLTRVEADERARAGAICLVPIGSLEQHGEHLPGLHRLAARRARLPRRGARRARTDVLVDARRSGRGSAPTTSASARR